MPPIPKKTAGKKPAVKTTAKTNTPVIAAKPKDITPELQQIVDMIDHFDKTGEVRQGGSKTVHASFKDSVHDTIVLHEMLNTKKAVEANLQNCGDVYYITEEEARKIEDHHRKEIKSMAIDALIIGAGCFVLGVFYGRKQIINWIENSLSDN